MNNHTKILGALVGLLILLPIEARSQDSMRVVILSPRLGAVITREQGEQSGQEVNVKYRAKESTPSVKVTYALGVRGYLHEWLPGASQEGASIITASMTGEMKIAYLKTLLRMKNVFLPPIYAEWKKSRE